MDKTETALGPSPLVRLPGDWPVAFRKHQSADALAKDPQMTGVLQPPRPLRRHVWVLSCRGMAGELALESRCHR